MHTRLISVATFFHPYSLLKPCGYCTCLIIMKHVPFSPNLYTTWHVLLNDLRDLRKWRKCKSFLLQVDVAGDGSTKTNIKMNTKWICNTSRSHPTSTPHDTFYVIISRDLRAWRTFKLAFPSTGWRCWAGNGSTKTDIKMNIKWLRLKRYSLFTNWHLSHLTRFFGGWINLPFWTVWRTVGFYENIPLQPCLSFKHMINSYWWCAHSWALLEMCCVGHQRRRDFTWLLNLIF
jgi:hypothetical protein